MSRAYKIDRLGAKLALDLALGKQTEVRRVFEALRGGESKGKEDDDEEDEEEEERAMFERVFGDGCKKVPKSNDMRFRAPLEALREALDVVDTLEEKKRRKRKKNGEEVGRSGDDGESRASSEYDSDDSGDSDDQTEYSTEDFQSSEASSLLSIGEHARTIRKEKNSEKTTSTQEQTT